MIRDPFKGIEGNGLWGTLYLWDFRTIILVRLDNRYLQQGDR